MKEFAFSAPAIAFLNSESPDGTIHPHGVPEAAARRPSAGDGKTIGDRKFVEPMALAARAFGATGWFFEVHPNPDEGLSDAANMLQLGKLEPLIEKLLKTTDQ